GLGRRRRLPRQPQPLPAPPGARAHALPVRHVRGLRDEGSRARERLRRALPGHEHRHAPAQARRRRERDHPSRLLPRHHRRARGSTLRVRAARPGRLRADARGAGVLLPEARARRLLLRPRLQQPRIQLGVPARAHRVPRRQARAPGGAVRPLRLRGVPEVVTRSASATVSRERAASLPVWAGLCFLVSGAAGLLYEVVWSKELAYLLGSSLHAVAAVVASFLLGLALGARLLGVPLARRGNGARTYALLELGVGGLGLAILPLLRAS